QVAAPVPQPLRRHSQTTLSLVPQNEEKRSLSLGGHVGFDSLPDQLVSKSVTQGFCFNILCVGETGIGKSTLMNTLFNTTFENEEASHYQNGVYLRPRTYDLQESNVHLKLTIVDTVGFGDQINKDESYKPIVDYIDTQFENYLQEELKIKRSLFNYHDTRIHICLYFIAPTGHSLKSLDLVTMKKLDSKVNIIPIIAKADTISKSELHKFKIKIMSELVSNGVQIYQFPTDDEAVAEINSSMNAHLPFAVVGSVEEVKVGNKMVRARQYPWGVVQVENESHCDFVKLREMLIRINMEDLREQTHARHYELYRRCKLEEMGFKDTDPDSQPFSLQETYEAKRKEFLTDLQRKEEEMRQMFVNKVKETEAELKEKERELHEKFEQLKRMHQEEKRKVEEKRRDLEEEMNGFNRKKLAAETLSLSQPLKKDKDKKK
uniref:Septin n=1 Tax=Electrophorus electricus TaxID=8005 RepID=A0A4W4H622_ELEEL